MNKIVSIMVSFHFFFCYLARTPEEGLIHQTPIFGAVVSMYRHLDWTQGWAYFAPPATIFHELAYSVQWDSGWTPLIPLRDKSIYQTRSHFFHPRGLHRILSMLKSRNEDLLPGPPDPSDFRAFYFQQIVNYFCRGDGKIDQAKAIRLYVSIRPMTPFFDEGTKQSHQVNFLFEGACHSI